MSNVPGRDVDLLSVLIQILEHSHQNPATERLQIPVSKLLQRSLSCVETSNKDKYIEKIKKELQEIKKVTGKMMYQINFQTLFVTIAHKLHKDTS
jgi:hypothetical protein